MAYKEVFQIQLQLRIYRTKLVFPIKIITYLLFLFCIVLPLCMTVSPYPVTGKTIGLLDSRLCFRTKCRNSIQRDGKYIKKGVDYD